MKLIDWIILILLLVGGGWVGTQLIKLIEPTWWIQSWLI